jgi:hypothetical protein
MKIQKIAVVLTVINLLLMTFLLAQLQPAQAKQQQGIVPVLRGRALEIVDSLGKTRASITIEPPVVVDGVQYPETVLLRLRDPKGNPSVKIDASETGGGFGLSDKANGGVRLIAKAKGSFVEVKSGSDKKIIEP